MRNLQYKRQILAYGVLAVLCFALQATQAHAAGSSQTIAQAFHIAKGNEITTGALVSTKSSDSQTVELATNKSAARLIGVIDTYPLLVIADNENGAHVVLSGTTTALVSDINGPIKASDKITASPIAGVGMRASANSQVVGTALTDFQTTGATTRTIKDSKGKSHTVHIGSVPLQVGISYYQTPGSDFLPPFVQKIANAVAGRPVSLTRILVSSLLLLTSFVGVTALVYAATRSAMISLGRNPLAAHDIRKSLYQVIAVAGSVAAVTLLASYLILAV